VKLIVKETFEQGLPRADGGAIKLLVGTYQADKTEHGLVVGVGGRKRTIPHEVVNRLTKSGLIATE